MSHRVPTGKATSQATLKPIHCPKCSSEFIGKTADNDFYCKSCSVIIKDNAVEVDKYFKEEYDFLVDFNGLGGDDESE